MSSGPTVLCSLPNELILSIANHLPARDIFSLTLACRRFCALLPRSLRSAALDPECVKSALWWSVLSNKRSFAKWILENSETITVARTPDQPGAPNQGPRDVAAVPVMMFACSYSRRATRPREYVFYSGPGKCDDATLDWVMEQRTRLLLKNNKPVGSYTYWFTNAHDYAIRTGHKPLLKLALFVGDREPPYPELGRMPKSLHALAHIVTTGEQQLAQMALTHIKTTHSPEIYQIALDMSLIKTIDRPEGIGAEKHRNTDMARFLIAHGANPNVGMDVVGRALTPNNTNTYTSGLSALHRAVQYCSLDMITILLKHGANANIQCPLGNTPLILVSCWISPSAATSAQILLDNGADINAKTHKGVTVLMANARDGNVDLIRLLLNRGAAATINARDDSGRTALHIAVLACRKANDRWRWGPFDVGEATTKYEVVIKLFLENGADPNIQDLQGNSPLGLLMRQHDTPLVRLDGAERKLTIPEERVVKMLQEDVDSKRMLTETEEVVESDAGHVKMVEPDSGHVKKKSYLSRLVQKVMRKKTGAT